MASAHRRMNESRASEAPPPEVTVTLDPAVAARLGQIQTLPEFLATVGALSLDDRLVLVDQAKLMIEQVYVHLPFKRVMHAIDPVQRLRLLRQRIEGYTERAFHNEMIAIFVQLRDLHTNYILPRPYRRGTAFLPVTIEECFVAGPAGSAPERRYLVTRIAGQPSDPSLVAGVVVTHWNGMPIDRAVGINADREMGSNLDARHLRGLETMSLRWMGMSLPPDEEWVILRYLPPGGAGTSRDARLPWRVAFPEPPPAGGGGPVPGVDRIAGADAQMLRMGIDARAEMHRRTRKLLFASAAVATERRLVELGANAPAAASAFHEQVTRASWLTAGALAPERGSRTASAQRRCGETVFRGRRPLAGSDDELAALAAGAMIEDVDLTAASILPDVFKEFGKVTRPEGNFGYVRIVTFDVGGQNIQPFIREFVRILALLPQDGLILDLRGNGGGVVAASEGLLQTLTPATIEPERFHVVNTPLVLGMCQRAGSDLAEWAPSVEEAVQSGTTFSKGFPLTPPWFCNSIGQTYQGPVVLVVDAGCYSATDIFAAGFQDHGIGAILATSGRTGAGGANVWTHEDLAAMLAGKDSPIEPLPGGASFRVAIRRCARVGARAGDPVEDFGVAPDQPVHLMTPDDVLHGNPDLIRRACTILAGMPRQSLRASHMVGGGRLLIMLATANLDRVDTILEGRVVHTLDVKDGDTTIELPLPEGVGGEDGPPSLLEFRGYRARRLVASQRATV